MMSASTQRHSATGDECLHLRNCLYLQVLDRIAMRWENSYSRTVRSVDKRGTSPGSRLNNISRTEPLSTHLETLVRIAAWSLSSGCLYSGSKVEYGLNSLIDMEFHHLVRYIVWNASWKMP